MLDEIRVVLADDHAVVRAGLKAVVGTAKAHVVVGAARTGRAAGEAGRRTVLLDGRQDYPRPRSGPATMGHRRVESFEQIDPRE